MEVATAIWLMLHQGPAAQPQFEIKPAAVEISVGVSVSGSTPGMGLQDRPPAVQAQRRSVVEQQPTPDNPAPAADPEPVVYPGDYGYVATCPNGYPAQGSCETPEGAK